MEATQMLDFGDQSDANEDPNPAESDVVAGQLIVNAPDQSPELYPLRLGMNIIGRQSTARHRDQDRLSKWKEEYHDRAVHGVFLNSTGVSATHAAIFLEAGGSFCFVKDLGSRNKTFFLKNAKQVPLRGDDRYTAPSGSYIKLGALECRIEFSPAGSQGSPTHMQPSAPAAAEQEGSMQEGSAPAHGSPAGTDKVDATPDLEGPGHEAASPESPTGHLPVEQTCGGWPAKQLAAATQLGPGMPAEEQDEACNQDLVLGTLIQDDAQLGEDTEDPLSVQPGQPHDGNTAMAPNTAAHTDTSDLDTVWQPELTVEEAQGRASQQEISSPQAAKRAPSLQPEEHTAEPEEAKSASPLAHPSQQVGQHSTDPDSDKTIASTPSDLGQRAGLDEVQSNEGSVGPPPPADARPDPSLPEASQAPDQDAAVAAPWRRRLPPRGAGLAETQLPDSQAVRNSMSEAGHIAAMFPATEADPAGVPMPTGLDSAAEDSEPAAAPQPAPRRGSRPARGQKQASKTPEQEEAEPAWMLAEPGPAAAAKEEGQADRLPPSTSAGVKTWSRRSRGASEQHTAAAATAPELGQQAGAGAPRQSEAAAQPAQPQPAQPRRDAFDFPDSATPLEALAAEESAPNPAGAQGRGRGRGRGRAAGKAGREARRGEAAAKARQQPSRRQSTGVQPAEQAPAETQQHFHLPEAAAQLQAQDNAGAAGQNAGQATSFKAGSETQAAAHGLEKLAGSSERLAGSCDPMSRAPSPPLQPSQRVRKGRPTRRTSKKQQDQVSASAALQADTAAAPVVPAAQKADAVKAAARTAAGKRTSARAAAQQVSEQPPAPADEAVTLPDEVEARQDASADLSDAEEQLAAVKRSRRAAGRGKAAMAPRSDAQRRAEAADPHGQAAEQLQRSAGAAANDAGTVAARSRGRASCASGAVKSVATGPARQRPSRGKAASRSSTEPSPEAEAGSPAAAEPEADAVPQSAPAAKSHAGHKRKASAKGDMDSAPAKPPEAPPPARRGRGRAGKQAANEQLAETDEAQTAAAFRAKPPAGRRASTRQAKMAQSRSPSDPGASDEVPTKDSSAEVDVLPASKPPQHRAGKRKASTESPEPARASTGAARKLRRIDQKPVKVLFSTCLNAALRKKLAKSVQQLGGTVASDGPDFTHFVTLQAARGHNDRGFKKSLNTLIAVAAGRPIVTDGWVDASSASDAWVDPRMHLLEDTAAEEALGFNLAASYQRASHSLLLANHRVFLLPGLVAAEDQGAEGLKTLINQAGGQIDTTAPSKAELADCLVLGADKHVKKERFWAVKHLPRGAVVHTRSMLVDAILRQALDKRQGILFIV